MSDPSDVWTVAREACTPKQLAVLELRERGMSYGSIASAQRISVSSVRGHLRAASHNVAREVERRAG